MSRKISLLALVVLLLACKGESQLFHHGNDPLPPDPAPQPSDLSADQVVAKYVAARGGEEKFKSIKTLKMTGTWEADTTAPVTVYVAPGRYSRRIGQGSQVTMMSVVDGQTAWEINTRNGIVKPTPMSADSAARFRRLADPQGGALVNAKAKGNKVEMVGKQPFKGAQVYKLKVTTPDGTVSYQYIDTKTFLTRRVLNSQYVPQLNKSIGIEVLHEDYRDVGGLKFAFKETANAPEANFSQTFSWDKIEINQPVDEAAFKAPK